jgi:hypothetical protein
MATERDRFIGGIGVFAIAAISLGMGGAFGWPYALLTVGAFALLISLVTA